ncbi:unnamed protein product [Cuscuta campestris]|uniref:Retrotransposon gag domain-containing protein n=1 Tax=Cuscuta campestris TaxID=132261 RepID=A0A484NHJ2_9ASTE|nr:unnamed protein product [Cuscuta campestris]
MPKPKLEPPKSDGSEPLRWLYQVKEYFSYYETPPQECLRCVTMMLEGPAADWFRWRYNNGLIDGWEDFVEKFKLCFDPLHYVDYLGQLAWVRQVGGVMEYQAVFEKVLTHVTDVPEQHLQSLFHAGLKNHLQHEISLLKPATLSDSFALARELEAKHNAIVNRPPAISTNTRESTASTPVRLLTRTEKMEKDAKGLCYNCDKKWSRDQKCGQFILMMGDEEEDDEGHDTEEEIDVTADISSLHSMAGVTTPRSLRLTGRISGQEVGVLIDGGGTHNFVHPHIVEKLGLPIEVVSSFRVYVGNGDSLQCGQNQWGLCYKLGRVSHDYEKVTMEFTWLGQGVTLRGEVPIAKLMTFHHFRTMHEKQDVEFYVELMAIQESPPEIPGTSLPKEIAQLLDEFGAVFEEPRGMPPRRDADHRIFLQPGKREEPPPSSDRRRLFKENSVAVAVDFRCPVGAPLPPVHLEAAISRAAQVLPMHRRCRHSDRCNATAVQITSLPLVRLELLSEEPLIAPRAATVWYCRAKLEELPIETPSSRKKGLYG